MTVLKWDFSKLSTTKYETNHHEIREDYQDISIVANTADISFVLSEDTNTSVVCHEEKNQKHSVFVEDGTLVIKVVNTKKWYEHIGFSFGTPKITVFLPQGKYSALSVQTSTGKVVLPKEYTFESIDITCSTGEVANYASATGHVKISATTGDILVENISAESLALSVSTGKITLSGTACQEDVTVNVSTGKATLTDIRCKNLISSGSTGDVTLRNVIVEEKLSVTRSTGDVRFDRCDGGEIFVKTGTGDVNGSLLTDKVFFVQSSTGDIDLPKTSAGGRCEIETSTGDITITLE